MIANKAIYEKLKWYAENYPWVIYKTDLWKKYPDLEQIAIKGLINGHTRYFFEYKLYKKYPKLTKYCFQYLLEDE